MGARARRGPRPERHPRDRRYGVFEAGDPVDCYHAEMLWGARQGRQLKSGHADRVDRADLGLVDQLRTASTR